MGEVTIMKITTFSPLVVTRNIDKNIRLFEKLGFEAAHKQNPEDNIYDFTMRDADGHQVDIARADVEKDLTLIRMNVPDFDAAFELLREEGFVIKSGRILETESSKSAMVVSPTGFAFDLCEHKK